MKRRLHLRTETLRVLRTVELRQVAGGLRDTPVTPECPSEYTYCRCSD